MTDRERRLLEAAKTGDPRKLGEAYADTVPDEKIQTQLPAGVSTHDGSTEESGSPRAGDPHRDEPRRSTGARRVSGRAEKRSREGPGSIIRRCVEDSGRSWEEVSEHMGLKSRSSAYRWASDTKHNARPRFDDVPKLCDFLGITPNQLFGYTSPGLTIEVESDGQVYQIKASEIAKMIVRSR